MGPNEADIIRVSVREANGEVADNTLDPSVNAEVVVEVEAGSAIFGTGGAWQVGVHVRDLDGGNIGTTLTPTPTMSGHLGTAPWSAQRAILRYTVPAGNLTAHKGHLGRVHAYLLVGTNAANYDATFVESEPFLVLP
jgi:hypothetical protein